MFNVFICIHTHEIITHHSRGRMSRTKI